MQTITQAFTLGEPQVAGPLAVFPVFGPEPRLPYRAFAQAIELGAFVKELDEGASVNELVVENPTDLPLLIYEGEEVLGAQQNRTFDTSVLVAAGGRVRLPVSCVERGRWDSRRSHEPFTPAPQAAYPSLRGVKRARANRNAAVGAAARPSQAEVWREVDARLVEHDVRSPSEALHDLYQHRRDDIGALAHEIRPLDGQVGAVAQVADRPAALDLVSRADVFAALLPRLAQGYALDALGQSNGEPDHEGAQALLDAALWAPREDHPTPGLGRGLRIDAPGLIGSGLEHGDELIQLCGFPGDGNDDPAPAVHASAPILRPSRRRVRRRS